MGNEIPEAIYYFKHMTTTPDRYSRSGMRRETVSKTYTTLDQYLLYIFEHPSMTSYDPAKGHFKDSYFAAYSERGIVDLKNTIVLGAENIHSAVIAELNKLGVNSIDYRPAGDGLVKPFKFVVDYALEQNGIYDQSTIIYDAVNDTVRELKKVIQDAIQGTVNEADYL